MGTLPSIVTERTSRRRRSSGDFGVCQPVMSRHHVFEQTQDVPLAVGEPGSLLLAHDTDSQRASLGSAFVLMAITMLLPASVTIGSHLS